MALDLLGIKPAVFVSIENDRDCAAVVRRAWPEVIHFHEVERVNKLELRKVFRKHPELKRVLIVGGPPCQPFSGLNADRKGFGDERSDGIKDFLVLVEECTVAAPVLIWDVILENVATMDPEHRERITKILSRLDLGGPLKFDAAEIGPIKRPRLYWTSFSRIGFEGFELEDPKGED